jgi:hypothetical protein
VFTTLGVVPAGEAVIDQGVQVGVSHRKNVAATTTVAAIGAAKLFVFFMPKRDATCASIAGRDINIGFVNEFHDQLSFLLQCARVPNLALN